MLIKKDIH